MAAPVKQDLTYTRGDTLALVVNIKDENGTAINITSRTYAMQFRTTQDIASISATFTCVVTDAANGKVECTLSPSLSKNLSPGYYYWDLEQNISGSKSTFLSGVVTILADVTRT